MAKEKNLTTVTSIAAADFARLVTSAGASVKATAANLAKYVVETYNGSTVAGSAQSVKSALDSLNSKITGTSISNNSDLNDYTDVGKYYTGASSATATIVNKPSDLTSAFVMEVQLRGGYLNQIIYDYGGKIYIRGKVSSGWQSWYKFTGTSV